MLVAGGHLQPPEVEVIFGPFFHFLAQTTLEPFGVYIYKSLSQVTSKVATKAMKIEYFPVHFKYGMVIVLLAEWSRALC